MSTRLKPWRFLVAIVCCATWVLVSVPAAAAPAADCPPSLACEFIPAAYTLNKPDDPSDYGNYDVASRGADGMDIRYIVLHNSEITFDQTLSAFKNPKSYVSSHYVVRSSDGKVVQMVENKDVAWTAGNWYVNMHSINIEHEGIAIEGKRWYTEELYQSSARLVRYLAAKYKIPLDRAHILGHDDVPGPLPSNQTTMHWDPGPFWDWERYMQLLGAPIDGRGETTPNVVTIRPNFATNEQPVTYCLKEGCRDVPRQGASFVYLHTAPSFDAPLVDDPALPGPGTTNAFDWGDKAAAGQRFFRVETRGDWDAIFFGGQKAWFHNPGHNAKTVGGFGMLVTPRKGATTIPIYGRAYPEGVVYPEGIDPQEFVPLQYAIPAGQIYVASGLTASDFYWSPTQTQRKVIAGHTPYYQIFFNHRVAFVRASDVDLVWQAAATQPLAPAKGAARP